MNILTFREFPWVQYCQTINAYEWTMCMLYSLPVVCIFITH